MYLSKVFSKLVSIFLLLIILYNSIFVISIFYNVNKRIDEYSYKSKKQGRSLMDIKKCEILNCSAIRKKNIITFYDKNLPISKTLTYSENIHICNIVYFDLDSLVINLKIDNTYIYLNLNNEHHRNIVIIKYTLPIIFFILLYIISSTIRQEQEEALVILSGNEALLANKTMINITENIHHELNTPLEVIDNKIEKIRRILKEIKVSERNYFKKSNLKDKRNRKIDLSFEEDFEFIKTASEQIFTVLEKMKGFKHLRYSNEDKNIKDIIYGAFKIVKLSNTNFEFKIDDELTKFKLNSSKLKNADLVNIMLNHLKNSLEANASKIYILLDSSIKNNINIRIIDNGEGIPIKAQKEIFKANFSTKDNVDSIRGNGMYLNKHILENAGGSVKLIESDSYGTTIELMIPAIKLSTDEINELLNKTD